MEISFGVADWPHAAPISADELVGRLLRRFPRMLVDREEGNAYVQHRLRKLLTMSAPEVVLASERACLDNTIFVSISDPDWEGATATSYLRSIFSPALEGVDFEVTDTAARTTRERISRDLADALELALCTEIDWETGGRLKRDT